MRIVELHYPGSFLDLPASEDKRTVRGMLFSIESCLAEAGVALVRYEAEGLARRKWIENKRQRDSASPDARSREWEAEHAEREATLLQLVASHGMPRDASELDRLEALARRQVTRARWMSGDLPNAYRFAAQAIYAKAFVSALDMQLKCIEVLKELPGLASQRPQISKMVTDFKAHLPELRDVRDSIQHAEERSQGKARVRGKTQALNPRPIDTSEFKAPRGALVIGSLLNNRYSMTLADGSLGQVEVSAPGLKAARAAAQSLIDCLPWRGPEHGWP